MKQKVRRRNIIIGIVLVMVLFVAGVWLLRKPADVVMKIDNYPITQDHLTLYENELRAEVTSYFYREHQLNPNKEGFWETEIEGEIPVQVLRQKAMDRLVYETVERIEASRYGISAPITLKEITKALEKENADRQSGKNISYGPSQYGLAEYISKTQMDIRDALKEKLLEGTLQPTDEQLLEEYENADPELFNRGCQAQTGLFMFYGMTVGVYPEELAAVWELVADELALKTPPAAIIAKANELSEYQIEYEEVEYDYDNLPRDNQELVWLGEQILEMEPGDISGVLDYGASQGIITVLEKSDYGTAGFDESRILLRNLWLEKNYPEYIYLCMEGYGYPIIRQ